VFFLLFFGPTPLRFFSTDALAVTVCKILLYCEIQLSYLSIGFLLVEDPKFSQINCLTNIFLQQFLFIVSYIFHRQAVQKGPFSI